MLSAKLAQTGLVYAVLGSWGIQRSLNISFTTFLQHLPHTLSLSRPRFDFSSLNSSTTTLSFFFFFLFTSLLFYYQTREKGSRIRHSHSQPNPN